MSSSYVRQVSAIAAAANRPCAARFRVRHLRDLGRRRAKAGGSYGGHAINVGPFTFLKIAVGLYRFPPGQPLDPAVQGELLRELYRDYPTLTQIPGGAMFSDPPKGRVLIVDPAKIELTAMNTPSAHAAIDRMKDDLKKIAPALHVAPPFRLRVEGAGTIQALEGLDPVATLKAYAPPRPSWTDLVGRCTFSGLRYVFAADDGAQHDVHVEPLFAQPDKFFITITSSTGPQGVNSLDDAIEHALRESEIIERLSDRIVSDIAGA